MSWDNNPYYTPEAFGLTIVGEVEWSEPCYSFDTTVVWKDEEGNFYWASDSGCSCPSPFEDYNSLEQLNKGTAHEVAQALQAGLDESYDKEYAEPKIVDLLARIMSA